MEAIFLTVLNMSLTASWILLALFLLRFLLRRAPRWLFCLLWIPVALRLALPFTVESVLSLLPSGEPIPQEILIANIPEVHTGIDAVNAVVNPFIAQELAPSTKADVTPAQVIALVAAILWIAGIFLLLAHALIGYLRLARRVQISAPLEDSGKISDPRIRICDGIDTPFILGIFRPRIYLPSAMDATATSHVIAHEKAHLARLDHWWKPLGYLLLTLHWFNPLVWIAYILFCRDLETACDEKVIGKMNGEEKAAYSEALLSCSLPKMRITACPLAFGEVGVKGRIKSILHYKKPTVWVIGAVVIAAAVLVVGFWTNPVESKNIMVVPNQLAFQIAHSLPGCPAIQDDCFYAYSVDTGLFYRVLWDNTKELKEGNYVIISYDKTREINYPDSYPNGFTPRHEIVARNLIQYPENIILVPEDMRPLDDIGSIHYDFDGDGYKDKCMMGHGGSSGFESFTFTVEQDGKQKYHELYWGIPSQSLSFHVTSSEKLQLRGEFPDGTVLYYDILLRDGNIIFKSGKTELIPVDTDLLED